MHQAPEQHQQQQHADPLTDPAIPEDRAADRASAFRAVFGYLACWGLIPDTEHNRPAQRWLLHYRSRGFTSSDLAALKAAYGLRPDWTPDSGFPFGLRRDAWPEDWRSR